MYSELKQKKKRTIRTAISLSMSEPSAEVSNPERAGIQVN